MMIPRFENGFPLNHINGEEIGILLTDERAAEMAIENVHWQADDTYFDAHFQLSINGELFYENTTTDAYGTWNQLLGATKKRGKHYILFLDSALSDLNVIHQDHYTLQYVHIDYIWGDDNYLISHSKKNDDECAAAKGGRRRSDSTRLSAVRLLHTRQRHSDFTDV